MYKLILGFYLLTSSIFAVRSSDEISALKSHKIYSKIEESDARPSSGALDETLSMLLNKDDILSISELHKIYNSLENFFAKTKYLKEPTENDSIEKAEIQVESRTSSKTKSAENVNSKPEERSSSTKQDVEITDESGKSKSGKAAEITSDINGYEGTTDNSGIDIKSADYLENDENDNDDFPKVALEEKSGKKFETALPNDESNTAWDLLDDIPLTRRMNSRPDKVTLDVIEKTAEEHSKPITSKSDIKVFNEQNRNDARSNAPTIFIPHLHPALTRRRLQIIPGLIVSSAIPVDFRKLMNQEKAIGQDDEVIEKSGITPESKDAEDINSEHSNAYPYTPTSESPQVSQVSSANMVFSKLAQASEHPYRITPNMNGQNLNNYRGIVYNLKPNYVPLPVVNMYKYATGYGRLA